jgi:hypothetical protein
MWDYSGRRDSNRLTEDELEDVEANDKVRTLTSLLKRDDVPKAFVAEPFSKTRARTEVHFLPRVFSICLCAAFLRLQHHFDYSFSCSSLAGLAAFHRSRKR